MPRRPSARNRFFIDRISHYYLHENSDVHRAAHTLAARSTDAYEAAREKVSRFSARVREYYLRARLRRTQSYRAQLREAAARDEIILTQFRASRQHCAVATIAQETGATIRVAPVDEHGQLIVEEHIRFKR